ncbi:hypothetical protein PK98_08280 [Croceibacterium mercuriale]|uniref:Short chain dehydrogenase-like proteobacteria domain-containing protein n=1 Tax=Croceibacterium mercuriale TaxID=1572751 RepID=A0A0B2C4D9_9SPHN|nr:hypothetical protein PK98_08280 [Croceibacterium mercuriale]
MLVTERSPAAPLDAAAAFHAADLPRARALLAQGGDLVIHFPPADHTHRGWRLAVVQELAREAAPRRVNGVEGHDDPATAATVAWLADAPAITGQVFAVDGNAGMAA